MKLKPLDISIYGRLIPYFENQAYPLSAYSLSSIIFWQDETFQVSYGMDGDAVVFAGEFANRKDWRHMLLPVSPRKQYSPDDLRDLARETGYSQYWCVPEAYLNKFGRKPIGKLFKILEQDGYHEYIYRKEDLVSLKGNKYAGKRNLINQFSNRYIHNGQVTFEPVRPSQLDECAEFLDAWCEERQCDMQSDENLACERRAILFCIENMGDLKAEGLLCRIDGQINAFGIVTGLTANMGVLHFEKAFARVKGLYQYFDRECARQLFNEFEFINKEGDMEVPGLIKAKKSYHPVRLEKSYQLVLR